MIRSFTAVVFASALALTSCAAVEGLFESAPLFDQVRKQALSITGIEPRLSSGATALAGAIESALGDPASASLQLGDQLDVLVDRFDDGTDELGSKRNRLKTLGNRLQSSWDEVTLLLPEGHPWKDPLSATDERQRLVAMFGEVDSQLSATQSVMSAAVASLRTPISALRKAAGQGQIEAQRAALETGLEGLHELPDRLAADMDLVRALAEEFSVP